MKILVIAGPYEADRIRQLAEAQGVEVWVAEPGDDVFGWMAQARPDLVVMAPGSLEEEPQPWIGQMRHATGGVVPLVLVGDGEERARLEPWAEMFLERPVGAEDLLRLWAPEGQQSGGEAAEAPAPQDAALLARMTAQMAAHLDEDLEGEMEEAIKTVVHPTGARWRRPGESLPLGEPRLSDSGNEAASEFSPDHSHTVEAPRELVANMLAQAAGVATPSSGRPQRTALARIVPLPAGGVAKPARPSSGTVARPVPDLSPVMAGRNEVLARYPMALEGTYFQFLGVELGADVQEIRRAYTGLRMGLAQVRSDEALSPTLGAEGPAVLDLLEEVLDEAYRVLMDPEMRRCYRSHLKA